MLDKNLELLQRFLPQLKERGIKNLINGNTVEAISGKTFENTTPIDGNFITHVAESDKEDIDNAAQAAMDAFAEWKAMSHKNRRDILYAIAEKIEEHADEIAVLESYDTGQPIRFMKKAAIRGAANFKYFADKVIDAQNGLSTPDTHHANYTIRQPIGPVGIITPWNTPFMLSTWKIAPALAAGCTVVHKPAEFSPVTANRLAELAHEAGLPRGVWNVVHGFGEKAGKSLTEHEYIKAVAFIGETTTGSHIMKQGAPTLKRVHLELGGQNPIIVFNDADVERALDAAIFMKYSLNGERCTSSSRLLLQKDIYSDFVEKLKKRVAAIKVGHPLDPVTEIGPMIHPTHQEKVLNYGEIGKNEGATLAVGGGKPDGLEKGCYVNPTLFIDASKDMRIAQEEVFGPFLTVIPFETEEEAIKIANAVKYGLTAYIWTKDVSRAHRIAHQVEAGMVWINSQNVRHLPTPFGGVKYSGIGRDGGEYSFNFYMETKNISIALGDHDIPKLGIE
ncbi:5-carboxymethyl-2-hydroxymuconic-semialdehyde dehydrogenase [Aquimarina sp. EL_43]|uniref:5-carboxymethyl-2-hydroxymuconate semialdehyde dehydrogenase n=1 Tax=unclassified Aquimarina TaxID=2627091 RepID=UPI0018CA7BD0|nr:MULTISPECIES: 5-carboxymethyl-2-hydroxymuconate semialdehyde dehydrogenase [unclassified Aquimarina]MBG6132451.1 5-carboxymethyl-2-hydroxymuconic-semialdehyde dehydrogenase [Aquimarina sp. EL_35]MBG6152582.1 5-carboxymethyl-2-hydroxymuconic-semialdehyde dehydrogenase [Aquimarina sp. EL_32]MBG6170491.1 5-carboxymethyl-2-hydroxymuconic-semialdehyde dehydrogenase [Aquimarina sp. EL_43]